jgi:hypothetical protein
MASLNSDAIADLSTLGDLKTARTGVSNSEGSVVVGCLFSQLDNDVDVQFEQSLDDTNYDGVYDAFGERVEIKCEKKHCVANTDNHFLTASLAGVIAPYIRAVVRKKEAADGGALTIQIYC